MKKLLFILITIGCLLHSAVGLAFTLSVTPTNETCPGNGSLTCTATNTDPNGSIVYVVYKLPNTITPFASGSNTIINGLTAGDYRVIAKETVGGTTTQVPQDITIVSTFSPLTYTLQSVNQACTTSSAISVTVVTGTAATYEIFSGPVIVPPQASNTFTGLPVGTYTIKVIDSCGNAVVQTFTTTLNPTNLTIKSPVITDTVPPSCTSLVVSNTVTAATGTVIGYPLTVQYTLYIPGAPTPTIVQQIVGSGGATSTVLSQTVPFSNQTYPYDISITDACGTTYPPQTFLVENSIKLSAAQVVLVCNQYYFTLTAENFSTSYTLNFTSYPAGFTPSSFNASYPGPYTQGSIDFGSSTVAVPFGDYTVDITDTCGKTKTLTFSIISRPPVPEAIGTNNGCLANNGRLVVQIPSYKIVTAIITAAPWNYPFPLPHNVTAFIDANGILTLDPVPLGNYTLELTDNCNDILDPLEGNVPGYTDSGLTTDILQSCDLGKSSIKINSNNAALTIVKITGAPPGYPYSLPHDVSNLIVNATGAVYLNDLLSGTYTFEATDSCGFTNTITELLQGYSNASSSFSLVANCGSFDIPLNFVSNVTVGGDESFWLQKLIDATTNTWGNPSTGVVYPEGTSPDAVNSYLLTNNTTNYNLTFNGTFRIVRHFNSYNSGSDINNGTVGTAIKDCIEILSPTLNFNNALEIKDVYRIPCSISGNLDVILITNGTPPLHYYLIEKDGLPFSFDNGNSNIFLNIAPGIYKFEVQDNCGNSINRTFDVSDLASLVIAYPTCPLVNCVTSETGNETFNITAQNPIILGSQSPNDYTISYYTSLTDADAGTNQITNLTNFDPSANPKTIFVRLIFNLLPNCYQTDSFDLIVGQIPKTNLNSNYFVCDAQPVLLDASIGNLNTTEYSWSNGFTTPSITISQVGITNVSVTAMNTYGSCNTVPIGCSAQKDVTVQIVDIPKIDHIDIADWTDNENSITIITTTQSAFQYSIDGSVFQDSNVFDYLKPGLYTVYVRDINGCSLVSQEVWLLNYPKFFTPNSDGINDKWFIRNSDKEPHFTVLIYDRYGKLMTSFRSSSEGWDGTFNGSFMFSSDYWFVVNREDGRVLKGHFTLKR